MTDPANGNAPVQTFNVRGHSGCNVRIRSGRHGTVVEKSAADLRYSPRLATQIAKQAGCAARNSMPSVRVPRILEESELDGLYSATMEYVYFHDSVTFFAHASRVQVDNVARILIEFVDAEIAQSEPVDVAADAFRRKIQDIRGASSPSAAACRAACDRLERYLDGATSFELPVGICHGDLTFSNIMVAHDGSAVALIDFLDSFVESPIVDIAKLRQDTRFGWTLLMSDSRLSATRFRQVMAYLDRKLVQHYAALPWFARHGDFMLAMNLLRIAPYAHDESVLNFVFDSISSLELSR